jgi:hypothetical protein
MYLTFPKKLMETGEHGLHLEHAVRLVVEELKPAHVSATIQLQPMVELLVLDPHLSHKVVIHNLAQEAQQVRFCICSFFLNND